MPKNQILKRNKLLKIYILPRVNYEEIKNMNRSIINKKVQSMIKTFPTRKTLGPDGFTSEVYQTFRELVHLLVKLFHQIEEKPTLLNLFYASSITLIPKPKTLQEKKTRGQYPWWTKMPKSSIYYQTQYINMLKGQYIMTKGVHPWVTRMFQHIHNNKWDHHMKRTKDQNQSYDAENSFNKIQNPCMIKMLNKWCRKEMCLT